MEQFKEKIKYVKCNKCKNIIVVARKTEDGIKRETLKDWYDFIWFLLVFTSGVLFGLVV